MTLYNIPLIQISLRFSHSFDRKLVVDFIANGKETTWVRINSRFEFKVGHSDFQGHFSVLDFNDFFFIKGQTISERNCGVFSKKQQNYLKEFCPSL